MENIIIQSRITPPQAPLNIIPRSRIIDSLENNRDKKVILVTAPAGYGKTTVISEYIHSHKHNFAWFHISHEINSPFVFFTYIIYSISKIKSGFGKETLSIIKDFQKVSENSINVNSSVDEIIYRIVSEISESFSDKILLIIDDLHDVSGNDWLNYSLDKFISETPNNLQIIITSRYAPDINLSHLRAKRFIHEVSLKELMLNQIEVKNITDKLYSMKYSDNEVAHMTNTMSGWVTGIHMFIQATGGKLQIKENSHDLLPESLFEYFANEIFSKLDDNTSDFLLATAHLINFDEEICNYLTGNNNSREILTYLSGRNIFTESVQLINEKGQLINKFNYIQLFRTFLINKAKLILPELRQKEIFRKISSYYQAKNDLENAMDFSLLAEDYNSAISMLTSGYKIFFQTGNLEKMMKWIDNIENNGIELNGILLYNKGVLSKYHLGSFEDALKYFDKAIAKLTEEGDKDFIETVQISRSDILLNQGKINIVIETLESKKNSVISSEDKTKLYYNLGNAYFYSRKYNLALEHLNIAVDICRENQLEEILADIHNVLGNIHINNGDFTHSIHYYELALSKVSTLNKKFTILANLSILYSRQAKFEKAREIYENALSLVKFLSSPVFVMGIKFAEYSMFFEASDYSSAKGIAEEINQLAIKLNNYRYGMYLSYTFLGDCCLNLEDNSKANEYYELSKQYIDPNSEGENKILNVNLLLSGKNTTGSDDLENSLTDTYDYLSSTDSNYDKTYIGFLLAEYYYQQKMYDTALEYFKNVVAFAKEKEYYSFLLKKYISNKAIFNFALHNNIHKDVTGSLFSRVIDLYTLEWLSPRFKNQINEKVSQLYDIRVYSLGNLEFYVSGMKVDESKWKRKMRKLILYYLFMQPNYSASKDLIVETFFPDTPLESIDNTFHQAVSNLRSALKADVPDGKSKKKDKMDEPEYIVYEDKVLKINNSFNYYSDISEFDRLTASASLNDMKASGRIEKLKTAIGLYKGDFLSGHYESWIENVRDEYRNKFIKYSEMLLKLLDEEMHYNDVILYGEKLLATDKLNEKAYIYLIRAYVKTNKENFAKTIYKRMIDTYKNELSEEPPELLVKQIGSYIKT